MPDAECSRELWHCERKATSGGSIAGFIQEISQVGGPRTDAGLEGSSTASQSASDPARHLSQACNHVQHGPASLLVSDGPPRGRPVLSVGKACTKNVGIVSSTSSESAENPTPGSQPAIGLHCPHDAGLEHRLATSFEGRLERQRCHAQSMPEEGCP